MAWNGLYVHVYFLAVRRCVPTLWHESMAERGRLAIKISPAHGRKSDWFLWVTATKMSCSFLNEGANTPYYIYNEMKLYIYIYFPFLSIFSKYVLDLRVKLSKECCLYRSGTGAYQRERSPARFICIVVSRHLQPPEPWVWAIWSRRGRGDINNY